MKCYDKNLLDNRPLDSIMRQLNHLQENISDYTIKPEYSKVLSDCMGELLEYYYTRLEKEQEELNKDPKPRETQFVAGYDDLPF